MVVGTEFSADFEDLMAADEDDEWAKRLRRRGHEVGRPIFTDELEKCRDLAAELNGVETALQPVEIRVQSQAVTKRKAYGVDGHDFLSSFIVDDLAKVAERAETGAIGGALEKYLRPDAALDTSRRVDVQKNLDTVQRATAPDQVPLGRWPEKVQVPVGARNCQYLWIKIV
ncbi:hypothetical protein [Saccharopolyspora sp. ASAGF58]|uniref:hypothetical protein n=1 Tax=Saccharopolyspora sp. ASAGF58 TaxID=2719023 RepID=UPI00144013F6|nr:hypothetical protein [Saccharopolyspora sp. ASAGF58]QIZ35938.1 hypothetical protein FDZ84_16110 [Saccharopolyspora sp. ASAGF58]